MACWGLCRRRTILFPSGWGCLLLLLAGLGLAVAGVLGIYPFLAERRPFDTGPVVVEGWAARDTLRGAITEFRRHQTPVLYVTGGTLDEDLTLATHLRSYADLAALRLQGLGVPSAQLQPVPAGGVEKDRTFASGVALRQWLEGHGGLPPRITLVTEGPHARRSCMLFQQAFEDKTEIGVLSVPSQDERTKAWWTYSQGFRTVVDELIAYLYAKLLFWRTGI